MYKIGMKQVCPQVVGGDTWNPNTGECGPGPSAGVIPATGYLYEPIVVTGPFLDPDLYPAQTKQDFDSADLPSKPVVQPEKKGNAVLLLGVVAVMGIFLLTKK